MRTEVAKRLSAHDSFAVLDVVEQVERLQGYRPLSDQAWLDLTQAANDHFVAAQVIEPHDGGLIAYAQASETGGVWSIELVMRPTVDQLFGVAAPRAMVAVIDAVRDAGASEIEWLVQDPTPKHEALAVSLGLTPVRRVHQMRCGLPTHIPFELATRPFDPDRDIDTWLHVNNRAFVRTEQGTWTADSVRSRMTEPWFDPTGFLIHEVDGRMAGFCWTKIHDGAEPPLGEIYVIAADPDFQGRGLGRALTLAGLDSLAGRGIRTGMLFVHGSNVAAIRLYDQLGFVIHRTDCVFHAQLGETPT